MAKTKGNASPPEYLEASKYKVAEWGDFLDLMNELKCMKYEYEFIFNTGIMDGYGCLESRLYLESFADNGSSADVKAIAALLRIHSAIKNKHLFR